MRWKDQSNYIFILSFIIWLNFEVGIFKGWYGGNAGPAGGSKLVDKISPKYL